MAYQTIIAAVDNDHSNDSVCDRAAAIGESCDARLILLHVVEPPVVPVTPGVVGAAPLGNLPADEKLQAELIDKSRAKLDAQAERIGSRVVDRRVVESAMVCETIHEVAREFDADLIVAGSHGRHGFSLFLAGSTSSDLLKDAPCDVLAVRIADD